MVRSTAGVGKRILVVDDDRDAREFISVMLEDTGYAVDQATNGREALEKIERQQPDLVLLDIMMPVMDGWTVLERLQGRTYAPRIVVLSAYADLPRALAAGARGCVPKPFHPAELLATCIGALAA